MPQLEDFWPLALFTHCRGNVRSEAAWRANHKEVICAREAERGFWAGHKAAGKTGQAA